MWIVAESDVVIGRDRDRPNMGVFVGHLLAPRGEAIRPLNCRNVHCRIGRHTIQPRRRVRPEEKDQVAESLHRQDRAREAGIVRPFPNIPDPANSNADRSFSREWTATISAPSQPKSSSPVGNGHHGYKVAALS